MNLEVYHTHIDYKKIMKVKWMCSLIAVIITMNFTHMSIHIVHFKYTVYLSITTSAKARRKSMRSIINF